ncbi:MAG: MoaD/ThiS family protein [Terriglobales bacterium]
MRVFIPTPLYSYTDGRSQVDASGATVDEVLRDLDRQFPGIRFRMVDEQDRLRVHMRIFVNQELAAGLGQPLAPGDEVEIIQALSGG